MSPIKRLMLLPDITCIQVVCGGGREPTLNPASGLKEHKAVPYEFGAKTQSDPHAGFKDVYFGANEPWGETLHDIFTLIAHKFTQADAKTRDFGKKESNRGHVGDALQVSFPCQVEHYVSVVGSMNALNFLTAIRPKQIHFFDLNPAAVSWGKLLVELVRASASPQDFAARKYRTASWKKGGKLERLLWLFCRATEGVSSGLFFLML